MAIHQFSPTQTWKSKMIEWVFIRGVAEHFHDGALFLDRSEAPLLVQEAGGNWLPWTQSLDGGV